MGLYVYFGVPGSGKTTHAAKIVWDNLKDGYPTFSNVPIKGAFLINSSDIGKYDISHCDLVIDEASIEYNNRKFKSLSQSVIQWYKLYRHYGVRNIYVYSQSYEDMDITLRRLADKYFLIRRTMIPWLAIVKPIHVKIGIDENTKQIQDQFVFDIIPRFIWLPKYWHLFDSWSAPILETKEYKCSGFGSIDPDATKQLKEIRKLLIKKHRKEFKNKLISKFKRFKVKENADYISKVSISNSTYDLDI